MTLIPPQTPTYWWIHVAASRVMDVFDIRHEVKMV